MVSAVDDGVGALLDSLEAFGLEENTIDFLGHAVALELNDDYL